MRKTVVGVLLAAALALTGCSSSSSSTPSEGQQLTVLAAASLTESFDRLKTQFEADHPGVTVAVSYGASSTLAEQIVQGSPADVFASASTTTMTTVVDGGKADGDPVTFANNILAIVTPPSKTSVTSLADLADPDLTVVLCDVAVPCGVAADKALAKAGVTASVDSREPDVKSVLAKVTSDDADAGIVYVTDAKAAGATVREVTIPAEQNQSTAYQIVAVAGSANAALAADWVAMVTGPDGQKVLGEQGFAGP